MTSHEKLEMVEARPDFVEQFAGIRCMTYETQYKPTSRLDKGDVTQGGHRLMQSRTAPACPTTAVPGCTAIKARTVRLISTRPVIDGMEKSVTPAPERLRWLRGPIDDQLGGAPKPGPGDGYHPSSHLR